MHPVEHLRGKILQLATMVEKIECCESSHAQLERHSHQLRQQLVTQQATHAQQNTELRTVLQDSQAGLKHLVCEKVCLGGRQYWSDRHSNLAPMHMVTCFPQVKDGTTGHLNPHYDIQWTTCAHVVAGGAVTPLL